MVENTAGKIWLDESRFFTQSRDEVFGTNEQDGQEVYHFRRRRADMIDPACGSGHILVEGFDFYIRCTERILFSEAVEKI